MFVSFVAVYRIINSHNYIHNYENLDSRLKQILLNEHDEVALESKSFLNSFRRDEVFLKKDFESIPKMFPLCISVLLGGLSIFIASLLLIRGLKKVRLQWNKSYSTRIVIEHNKTSNGKRNCDSRHVRDFLKLFILVLRTKRL